METINWLGMALAAVCPTVLGVLLFQSNLLGRFLPPSDTELFHPDRMEELHFCTSICCAGLDACTIFP